MFVKDRTACRQEHLAGVWRIAAAASAATMLHFSQCTDGGIASQGPSGSQILSSALSGCRLGTPAPLSLELTDSEEQPLQDATNMLQGPSCSQMHSQQFLSCVLTLSQRSRG